MEWQNRIHLSRLLSLVFYFVLLTSLVVAQLFADRFNWGVLAFQAAPLLIFLPGLMKGSTKTHVWICCILLFYSSKFISDLIVSHWPWLSILQALCAMALFTAAALYSHWQWKLKKQSNYG